LESVNPYRFQRTREPGTYISCRIQKNGYPSRVPEDRRFIWAQVSRVPRNGTFIEFRVPENGILRGFRVLENPKPYGSSGFLGTKSSEG
jgi:hypothetical protein